MNAAQEVFEVIRAGDATRLAALLAADRSLANARNERWHSTVLIAQYHQKRDLVTMLLAAGPELYIFDAASVGRTARVGELLDRDPSLVDAYVGVGVVPLAVAGFFRLPAAVRLWLARGGALSR